MAKFYGMDNFNANDYEAVSFEPLPAGEYPVIMTESETHDTKAGTGNYLRARFQVIDGEHKGRVFLTNFNYRNPNEKAENIGRRMIAEMCRAVGVLEPKDSSELHDKPMIAKVKVRQDPGYEPTNEAIAFKEMNRQPVAASVPKSDNFEPWKA